MESAAEAAVEAVGAGGGAPAVGLGLESMAEVQRIATFVDGFHDAQVVGRMPYRQLRPGLNVSVVALGGSAFGEVFGACSQEEVDEVVLTAVRGGVNLIDTAYWYGHGVSEARLGKALSKLPRSAYYLHSKCCRYEKAVSKMFDFSAERTLRAVDESLARLGVEYLDCMQVHDPEYAPSIDVILNETLPALQKAKDAGKIRAIGMTGYPLAIHRQVLERSTVQIDTCLTYCHYSLNDATLLDGDFVGMLKSRGVGLINASPLSMGLLTERGPPAWHPASEEVKGVCRKAVELCKARGVSIEKLAMNFSLREQQIPTTLVSTTSAKYMARNLEAAYELGSLTQLERETQSEIRRLLFEPMAKPSWEGVEVAQYWDLLERNKRGEDVGTLSTL